MWGLLADLVGFVVGIVVQVVEAVAFRVFGRRIERRRQDEERTRAEKNEARAALLGRLGVAATLLRPSGRVSIDGRDYEAVIEGITVSPGAAVRVTGFSPFALIVHAADTERSPK